MSKKAALYLIGGIICALAAVLMAQKYLASRSSGGTEMALTKVLVASKPIEFGTRLAGNVGFAPWPEQYVPEGAITSPEKLKERDLIARADFVRYQPILESMVVTKAELRPPGMFFESLDVDREALAMISPGDKVDIWKISGHEVVPFIRCAQVYSIGSPPTVEGSKNTRGSGAKNRIYVLLPVAMRETVLTAKLNYRMMVLRSVEDCRGKSAELVGQEQELQAREAEQKLQLGEKFLGTNQYKAALDVFKEIVADYGDTSVSEKARTHISKCKGELTNLLLAEARLALGRKEFEQCIELATSIEKDYPDLIGAVKQAAGLAQEAREGWKEHLREVGYRELYSKLEQGLKGGDIPLVKQLQVQFENEFGHYDAPPPLKSPEELSKEIAAELKELEAEFKQQRMLLDYFLGDDSREKALEKFRQLTERFPDHPYVQEAERQLREKGWLE